MRELSRATFSTLHSAFRELPAHVHSRNYARKVVLQDCNHPAPSKYQWWLLQAPACRFAASESHSWSQNMWSNSSTTMMALVPNQTSLQVQRLIERNIWKGHERADDPCNHGQYWNLHLQTYLYIMKLSNLLTSTLSPDPHLHTLIPSHKQSLLSELEHKTHIHSVIVLCKSNALLALAARFCALVFKWRGKRVLLCASSFPWDRGQKDAHDEHKRFKHEQTHDCHWKQAADSVHLSFSPRPIVPRHLGCLGEPKSVA